MLDGWANPVSDYLDLIIEAELLHLHRPIIEPKIPQQPHHTHHTLLRFAAAGCGAGRKPKKARATESNF